MNDRLRPAVVSLAVPSQRASACCRGQKKTTHRLVMAMLFTAMLWSAAVGLGCAAKDAGRAPSAPSGATFTGPTYLYNTIGSLTRLSNNTVQVVSGYGLVVGLNGTGSSEVPPQLREWLINEMVKHGVGRTKYRDALPTSPERLLASKNTAVVRVLGLIPPGAAAGSRFDLLITAADSNTTSLIGGRLWTTQLSLGGMNPDRFYRTPQAEGRGPVYMDPRDRPSEGFGLDTNGWQALVVAGGRVLEGRQFELVLNQPSRTRAAAISSRINERFPADPGAKKKTANAISPNVIELTIPGRFGDQARMFVDLVQYTFIDRSRGFMQYKAKELAERLIEDPTQSQPISLAWKAMGANVGAVLRGYYEHPSLGVRLTALEAGAFVGDERTSQTLLELAQHEAPSVRIRVAEALISLPNSNNGNTALHTLLNDPIRSVRIAAYESLVRTASPLIERREIVDKFGEIKLVIDRVPVSEPLIYITQKDYPRLVIFNPTLGFKAPTLAGIWNDRLMIRRDASDEPAELFYQYRDVEQGNRLITKQHKIDPTVATLVYILAHVPTYSDPQDGFSLTYGQVADAVYRFAEAGAIDAEVEIDRSQLAILLENLREDDDPSQGPGRAPDRPETAPTAPDAAASR